MIDADPVGPLGVAAMGAGPVSVAAAAAGPVLLGSLTIPPAAAVVLVVLTTQLGATITTQAGEPLEVAA